MPNVCRLGTGHLKKYQINFESLGKTHNLESLIQTIPNQKSKGRKIKIATKSMEKTTHLLHYFDASYPHYDIL